MQKNKSERELLEEISNKLDRVVAVIAAQGKDRDKQLDILVAAGCDSPLIGAVVGLKPGAVRSYQSRRRARGPQSDEGGDDANDRID